MKLVLAEKPSVAQSIAKVLGAAKREDGYLEGNGYVVSWCVGHLVELAQPEVYDAKYSKWAYADLPIFPMDWQYEVSAGTKKQFGILKKLMAREDVASLVCATDAGREGELIFRLVYHKAGCRKPFERLWISSMEDVAIKEGFENLRSGTEYDALYEAALCRERADWIVGINATRLFSTLYGQTLNVGRVMTPTLAMAVMREAAISAFKPELFYTVQIGLDGFTAASERFKTKAAAEAVKQSCSVAIVQKAECKEKTEKPPALYDLTSLQREANRVLGYTAQQTLDYTQNLYEKKLVTYPRTDSRFLTEDMAHMLKITSDGRKLGLDQRLMNTLLPDDPDSKLNACVGNILRIWQDGQADKLTQLVFCDLSTPKNDGTFNVYDDVKTKLIANGVPAEEVAFIHDADTEAKKKDLFAKVRTGQVRVLLGSTQKMGAGTNVQDKLVAVHHLDVGWRPSDMTQRNGRIIRQGNRNKEVQVYQYVTEGTFDAYLYQTLENKQKFISQIMTSKSPVRSCDDVDEQALSYAEIKALCAGNPLIKEKMDLDIDVARLKVLKADHQSQQYRMEDKLLKYFPAEIEKQTGYIHGFEADIKTVEAHPQIADGFCGMEIMGKAYTEKADAGEILLAACKDTKSADPVPLGSYRGFQMELSFDSFRNEFDVTLKGAVSHRVALGTDARGNITRLDNALAGILERLERANEQLNNLYNQQEAAKAEVGKPFPQEAELTAKSQRLAELDAALNMEDSVENRDERSESERPSVLADLKSKAEHIPPAKYSETREEVL